MCWIQDFKDYVQRKTQGGIYLPISNATVFNYWLTEFAFNTSIGINHQANNRLGFTQLNDGSYKLKFMTIQMKSLGSQTDPSS